jgi:hypothetical protein
MIGSAESDGRSLSGQIQKRSRISAVTQLAPKVNQTLMAPDTAAFCQAAMLSFNGSTWSRATNVGSAAILYIPYMRLLLSGVGETLRW